MGGCSSRSDCCLLLHHAAKTRARFGIGSIRVSLRQVAPRTHEAARFCGRGSVADPFATGNENGSDKAARTVGTIFAASLLRPPSVLLRRPHLDGQCVDAERMAAIHTYWRDLCRDVDHSKDFLQERGQE